jgi:hypothetical protein
MLLARLTCPTRRPARRPTRSTGSARPAGPPARLGHLARQPMGTIVFMCWYSWADRTDTKYSVHLTFTFTLTLRDTSTSTLTHTLLIC